MLLRSISIVVLVVSLASSTLGEVRKAPVKERWTRAQVIVKYKKGAGPRAGIAGVTSAKQVFGRFRLTGHAQRRGLDRIYLLRLDRDDVEATVARLREDPNVEYAEPNWRIEFTAVPNDPSYGTQWGLTKIGAEQAWDHGTSGNGVVIGVVDTGIDLTHPDLAANLWTNPGEIAANGIDDDGNGFIDDVHGWDFWDDDNDPTDVNGHGTLVAGVIGAAGNNAVGVSGVAWTAKIAALKIGGSILADAYAAIQALEYANMMGFRITNNSWGWWEGGQSFLLDDVIGAAEAAGHLVVAAAGNNASDNDQLPHYPSHYTNPNVISVTATTETDALSGYANWGVESVDLGAPGDNIETTSLNGTYGSASGTSLATPFVAGAAALLWTANPSLTAAQVRNELMLASEPIAALHGKSVSGGRLSLSNLFDTETTAPAAISDLTVVDATFRSVTIRFTATGDDGTTGLAARYDVRVSESPITEANFAQAMALDGEPRPQAPGTLETFKLTGLESLKTYYVAARVLDNAANAGAISNVATFTTGRAAVIFEDNAEGGARDWTIEGTDGNGGPALWHLRDDMGQGEWSYSNIANNDSNYDTGAANWGALITPELDLTQARDARIRFMESVWTERRYGVDMARVQVSVNGGAWTTLTEKMFTDYTITQETLDLSAYDGQRIRIRFFFDTVNATANAYPGWSIDDVIVDATSTNAPPSVDIDGPDSPIEDQAATLSSAGSSDPEGASLEYKWSFGDGTYAYTRATSIEHAWTQPGTYTVTLIAYDGSNVSDPVTTIVSPAPVNDRPVAAISLGFAPPPHAEETSYNISHFGSSDEEGASLNCRWNWGDGTTLDRPCEGVTPHTWDRPGAYTITLVVNDGELDSLPATQNITINETSNDKPIARPGGPYDTQPNVAVTLDGTASSDEETSVASYLWTFPDATTSTSSQPSATFATSGVKNVSLVVTDQTGVASQSATAQVRVCGGASANTFGSMIYTCPGGTARVGINVTSGILPLNVSWTDGFSQEITSLINGYYAERVVIPNERTLYTLSSLTDFLGCAGTVGTSTSTVDFASVTLAGTQRICPGQQATLWPTRKGDGPWTLAWSDGYVQTVPVNGDDRRVVSPSETTTYSITSATCASCPPGTTAVTSGSATVEVMQPLSAVMSGGGTSCNGGSVPVTVTISGGAPPYTVIWSDGWSSSSSSTTITRSFNPATATTYTAEVRSGSCSAQVSGSATVTPWSGTLPSVTNISGSGTSCNGATRTITATLAGEGLPFTLTWSDGYVQTAETLTATREVSPSIGTVYSVTSIRNTFGCNGTAGGGNATVTPWSGVLPSVTSVTGGGTSCNGAARTITATLAGDGLPFTVTWSDGAVQTAQSLTLSRVVSPSTETVYSITSIRNTFGCDGTAGGGSTTVTPWNGTLPSVTNVTGGGPYCPGGSRTITATLAGEGLPFTLTWSDGYVQTAESLTATRDVSPSSGTVYSITAIRNASGCNGTAGGGGASVYPQNVSATMSGGGTFCSGGGVSVNATLNGSAPFTITWSDGLTETVNQNNRVRYVSPSVQTEYSITAISDAFCNGTPSNAVTATPLPLPTATISVPGNGSYCAGTSATINVSLTGTGPFTIHWNDGTQQSVPSGNTATRVVSPASPTMYFITQVVSPTCTGFSSNDVTVWPSTPPTATVSGGGSYCAGGTGSTITAALSGIAPFTVTWSDGAIQTITSGTSATREVSPAVQTVYTVTSITDASCGGTASGSATVTPVLQPVITTQPQNKTISRNKTATLTVVVSGTGNNYQWYRGPSGTTTTPVGTNSASYTTPKLTSTTSYWVKVWKTGCTAPASATNSQTATVTVR